MNFDILLIRCLKAVWVVMINEWLLSVRTLLNDKTIRHRVIGNFGRGLFKLYTRVFHYILVKDPEFVVVAAGGFLNVL